MSVLNLKIGADVALRMRDLCQTLSADGVKASVCDLKAFSPDICYEDLFNLCQKLDITPNADCIAPIGKFWADKLREKDGHP